MEELNQIKELVLHFARGIWRFRWYAVPVTWVIMLGGIAAVDQIKDQYKAETKVYMDSSSILKPLLRGLAVETDFTAIVQLMVRQLLSRPNLERAARQMDLDLDTDNAAELETLINQMRRDINIDANKRSGVYTITYTDFHRERARKMVQTLLDIFIEDTLGKSVVQSDSAMDFLTEQIAKYDLLLREAEDRREDFKRKNVGVIPGSGNNYFNQLKQNEISLEETRLELKELKDKKTQLDDQIASLVVDTSIQLSSKTSLDLRIEEQEARLDDMLLQYTDEHPDVINSQHVLKLLRERKAIEAAEAEEQRPATIVDNPIYQELQIALSQTEVLITTLNTRINSMVKKQAELTRLVEIAPKVEAELQRLNRDYDVHKKNYTQLVSRREQAKISEDVESGTEQVKFRVIEPPFAPQKAVFPNRPLFDLGVLVVALGIGFGLSLLISLFQPVFYTTRDLQNSLGGSVLGSIPKFDTPEVLKKRRWNLLLFFCANLFFLGTAGVLIWFHSQGALILSQLQALVT
ncbi:MAG: polysaccharide chain length determinant protein (PEP-CTERM system associated) [Gammaproteobacteria bacterium]|jgi:polysaccharide chain length determinant protein (PEP-CTERM system associated)